MSAISFRDKHGTVHEVLFIKGDPGKDGVDGTVSFDELTDAQKGELAELAWKVTVDLELDETSTNAIANKPVVERLNEVSGAIAENTRRLDDEISRVDNDVMPLILSLPNGLDYAFERLDAVEQQLGGVETALDSIIAIQEALIGGASV